MKTLAVLLMTVVLVAPVSASDLCLWTLADSEEGPVRIGYSLGESIEAGIEGSFRFDSEKPGQIWGIFGVYKSPTTFSFEDFFTNDWVPSLTAQPYVGVSMSVDFDSLDDNRSRIGPLAGVILNDLLVVEYFYQVVNDDFTAYLSDGYKLRFGLHIEF